MKALMNKYERAEEMRKNSSKNEKVITSGLWKYFQLPDSARWEEEWTTLSPRMEVFIRRLIPIVSWSDWNEEALRFFFDVGPNTMTPKILWSLPVPKALVRLARKNWTMFTWARELARLIGKERGPYFESRLFRLERCIVRCAAWAEREALLERLCSQMSAFSPNWEGSWTYMPTSVGDLENLELWFQDLDMAKRWEENQNWARLNDRLASEDPRIAESYPEDFDLGQRLAPLYKRIVSHLHQVWAENRLPIFVHGRDGEIVFHLLKEQGVPTRYAVTSRSLTTESQETNGKSMAYLRRVVPQKAWHYDTGFAGSIPEWMRRNGWEVAGISLASSANHQYRIHGLSKVAQESLGEDMRTVVLDMMEHQPQRLQKPNGLHMKFDTEAPRFWARLAGVRAGLQAQEAGSL